MFFKLEHYLFVNRISQYEVWFQGYYFFAYLGMDPTLREQFKDHPHYARTIEFVSKYDAPAFDKDGETLPLEFFEPMLRRVFAQPRKTLYKQALETAG